VPLVLVEDLNHADGSAVLVLHGDAQRRSRPVPSRAVPFRIETHVLVCVLDVERLARAGDRPGEPLARLEPDFVDFFPLNHLGPELVGLFVQQVQGRTVGLHDVGDPVENHLQELSEVESGPERRADVL